MSMPASPAAQGLSPDPATGVPPLPDLSPDAPSGAPATQPVSPDTPLTLRQEAFCRHFAGTGNAAGAARAAGYAEGSARQTGHDLLERPDIAARVRDIRQAWRAVEREEAQILLGRLEQAWDVAVEKGSATLMLRVVRLQAELSGLDRRHAGRRAGLWPLPEEDALPHPTDADAAVSGTTAGPPVGPLAEAVRRGRHRTERALAVHRASRKALEPRPNFDEADWLATAHRLHGTVEERRLPRQRPGPARAAPPPPGSPALTNPDISLHPPGEIPAGRNPGPEAAQGGPVPTDPDISLHRALHRAGLLPADRAQEADEDGKFEITASPFEPAWVDQTVEAARRAGMDGDDLRRLEREAYLQAAGKCQARKRPRDPGTRSAG